MAKYSNVVEYNIVTDVDSSGIVKLQNELTKLKQSLKFDKIGFGQLGFDDAKIDKSIRKVNQLQSALTAAFNPKIGTLDLSKLNTSLQKEHTSLQMIVKDWEQMGTRGTMAISNLSNALLSMNKSSMNVNTTLSKIANTFSNTVRWGITASIFQEMMSSVQGAVSYMKNLDESLTQIQMVTNSSKENMRELAQYANNAAQALGSTTVDYTNAVKVFVQEGFSESESKQYANLSTKLANVSEQNTATTSDQITAYRNAFQLDYQQTVEAMDKVANVANNTASNVNELMTASQRAASVAQAVGSSQDSFLAAIATIESVTRQSAEEIGNGLKTIYQRFADIKTGKTAEDGVDYGQYAKALQSVGVDVLDAAGQFKGMDQILKELQEVWSGLDDTMKIAVGEKVAGKFQYNRFAALMNNPQYYQKALGATQGAEGMMDQMNEYYMDSIEGRLKTLQAAGEQVMSTLFNQDAVEPIIEDVTHLVNGLNDMVDAAGGLSGVLTGLSAIMLRTFSTQIAGSISNMASSFGTIITNSQNAKQLQTATALFGLDKLEQGMNGSKTGKLLGSVSDNYDQLSISTQEKVRDLSQQILELEEQKNGVLRAQEKFFKEISENAIEQQNIKEQEIAAEREIAEQKLQSGKYTQEQYEDEILRLDVLEDESLIYTKLSKEAQEFAKVIADGNAADEGMINRLKEMRSEASGLGINIAELEKLIQQLGIAEENLKMSDALINDMAAITQFEASINTLVKGLSAISSIAFGITMLGDAIKTLGDDSATVEEQINAVIMDGLMGLTMLIPAIVSLAQAEWNVVTATGAAIASKITNIAVDGLLAIAESLAAAGATGLADALIAVGIAMEATPVGWILTAIAAVVAIIGSCVIAYNSWQDSIHAASKEFETQQELLSKTKKNYTDLKDEVESLKQSLDSIGETRNSLADLTKGTDEWREAVRKLNDQILTLLQTYPELAQYVTNEDGVLNISDIGMDQFYQKQLDEVNHLAGVNSIQQINTLQAQNKKYTEDFYNQWGMGKGLSKEEIETAISNGAIELKSGADELNTAFSELKNKIEANTFSINNLSNTVGSLNASYTDYSKSKDITSEEINQKKNQIALEYGGRNLDIKAINDQSFLEAVSKATGKNIVSATDASWFNDNIKLKTNTGDDAGEFSSEELLNLLAESQLEIEKTDEKLKENRLIYETFGAKYDEVSKNFIDSTGNVISSLNDLEGISGDQIAAIEAFQDGIYNDIAIKDFNGSFEQFITELKRGTLSVDGFSEALLAAQIKRKEEEVSKKGTALLQEKSFIATHPSGSQIKTTLSEEEAKAAMADIMQKLNNSSLPDEEKLQLMDKINWNMPIEDILANLQHAADTGNINTAFLDNIGIEDDSEREAKVLDEYDIDESTLNAYKEQLQTVGALAEQHDKLTNSLKNAQKNFKDESEEVKAAKKQLQNFESETGDIAIDLAQTQKGLEALSNGMAKYGDILKKGDKTTLEYAEAMGTVKKALADTLNISEESISNSLVEDHLQDIEALAAGDEEALNRLRAAAGQDIVVGFYLAPDSDLTEEHMEYLKQKALEVNSLNIEVGAELNDEQFLDTLDEMLWNGELTRDQVNEYLRGIGLEPEFHTVKKKVTLFDTPGFNIPLEVPFIGTIPFHMGAMQVPGYVEVPQIGSKNKGDDGGYTGGGGTLRRTASPTAPSGQTGISPNYVNDAYKPKGGGGNKGKSGGSGKDTKPKDKDKTEWDYLTDITNDLDRAAAVIEKLSKLEDRLYGSSRVSQIKKLQKEYKNYIKLLEQEVKLAENHAQLLRNNAYDENGNLTINGYGYRAGVGSLQFDAQNNLENGKEIEARLVDRVNAAINDYNAHRNADDASYYEERVSLAQKDHEGFLKALSEYESTLGKIEDGQSQIQDYKEKIQDATDEIVDAIQDSIEDVLKAIDNQRDFNKMYRDWMQGGNSYSHFNNERQYYIEGLEGLLSSRQNSQSSIFETQLSNLQGRINDIENIFDGNSSDADDEKLSEQAAFENLQEATNNIMDSLNQVIDYYDSLLETIEGASDKMDELIDGRLDEFDKLSDYLDTRLDQIKLLFGDNSYEEQAQIYNQRIAVDMEKMVSINTAIEAKQATVDALEKLEASNKELSTEERKELQDARNKVNDLQKEQLNTETKLLQEITERLGVQTNAEMKKLGKELFGGIDVEWLSQQWEMATRFSEKYFDDYNRAFELQKMQLKFQKALSDNQNSSIETQGKINSLMEEYMSYLREKKNLSEYDIKHAQAQLDMLQKQIALQDAQNNKSQMRLQRNSAGNYDFVYAADEGVVEQAKNELLIAQQDLYNLSKQMYTETYADLVDMFQNAQDMAVQIATDTSLTVEERAARIQTIHDNLNEYFQNSSIELSEISINLYNSFVDAQQSISEENLGALDAVFEQMRENSSSTGQSMVDNIGGVKETAKADMDEIETVFKDGFGKIKTDVEGNAQGMQSSITSMVAGIESKIIGEDGSLNKIRVGTNTEFGGIQSDVSGVLESIDKRFGLSETYSIGSVEKIQESINTSCEAITGLALGALEKVDGGFQDNTKKVSGYLGQFKTDVDEALKSAGDNYKTFTKDSVDYSNEHLGQLKDTTQAWRQDLDNLNSMIRISAGEIKTWKKQIDLAIDSSSKLISKANTLQEKIGMDAAMASIATGSFSDFEDAAYRVGSAVSTMSHDIESAYYSIRDAADTAADAYNNMASAALNAANEAIWAQDEASNAQGSLDTLVSVARNAMDSVARSVSNILSDLWSSINSANSASYDPYVGNIYYYGDGYWGAMYDTGGYTGSWSDKGIDDKSGKWAILHQKELVLNADDTKNMLSTVELVHDIMSNIDKIPSLKKMVNQQNFGDTVEQRVEINATFPGVTEAIEIKQALEHLADNAYQVANRYKY